MIYQILEHFGYNMETSLIKNKRLTDKRQRKGRRNFSQESLELQRAVSKRMFIAIPAKTSARKNTKKDHS